MDQDELGNYLLCVIAKSYEIFTKSQNHKECESAILIHINLSESTVMILDETSDQEQLNENDVKSWKDHVAVFEILLEGFSKLYEVHNLHFVCCQFSPTVTKDSGNVGRSKVIIKKENLEELRGLGFSWVKIASILGVSRWAISRRVDEFGLSHLQMFSDNSDNELENLVIRPFLLKELLYPTQSYLSIY